MPNEEFHALEHWCYDKILNNDVCKNKTLIDELLTEYEKGLIKFIILKSSNCFKDKQDKIIKTYKI